MDLEMNSTIKCQKHLLGEGPFIFFSIIQPIEQKFSKDTKNVFAFRVFLYCFRIYISKKIERQRFLNSF